MNLIQERETTIEPKQQWRIFQNRNLVERMEGEQREEKLAEEEKQITAKHHNTPASQCLI